MNKLGKAFVFGLSILGALVADISVQPLELGVVPEAAAVFGRPFTPISVAGVARRTTRRAVVYSGSAAASSATTISSQQQVTTQEQTHRPEGAPPIGAVVTTLPAGCTANTVTIDGVQYYDCTGVYYRTAFQGNSLVYVVTQP